MIRLYTPESLNKNIVFNPDEKQTHYLIHVMRLKDEDTILVFNGIDGEWSARIQYTGKKAIALQVQEQISVQEKLPSCILCPALIKKENMDLILQKATELGVTEIFPLITDRTVVRAFNFERAQSIIYEACEQCERTHIPILHQPQSIQNVINQFDNTVTLVHLAERKLQSDKLLPTMIPAFFIGPEGGFSERENDLLSRTENLCQVHLGKTILRAETAALAVISAWQFRLFE